MSAGTVSVVGLHGGAWFGAAAEQALRRADVLVGAERQHRALASSALPGEAVALHGPIDEVVDLCAARRASGERVCVLASGDPGFFGIVRALAARLGQDALEVHPAPSSVSLAFARAGVPWDDAAVVSCHGRPIASAAEAIARHPKVAVLVSPDNPAQAVGAAARDAGCGERDVWVCTDLGDDTERVVRTDIDGLASGTFDACSVVVAIAPGAAVAPTAATAWGRDADSFAHRAGLVTKAEVRAIALGKLDLPAAGVLWDVGAGSGSVAVEAARLAPGLHVLAIERDTESCERIRANAAGTAVRVVHGEAPAAFAGLPDADRAFVGGGGVDVLDAVRARMRPGGTVVATYAVLATAAAATERLGSLVQVQVSRGTPIGASGGLRLAAENPVFVVWGPA